MNRQQMWLVLLVVAAPAIAAALDCELQLDVVTPVADIGGIDPGSGTVPEINTGFPAVAMGVYSGTMEGVAGDNRFGVVLQYDRVSWGSSDFSLTALQAAWRYSMVGRRPWKLWASIYAGPSWFDSDYEPGGQTQNPGALDIAWRIAPAIEFTWPGRRRATLVSGLRYVQYLNRESEVSPFESGLACYVGAGWRLN